MAGFDGELDRLFGLPLDEFTRARNDLAKRLQAEQDPAHEEQVRALKKPTVPAWAINQLTRLDRPGIRAVLDAGEELRTAQRRLLGGEDARDEARAAAAHERQAVERLVERAREVLTAADRAPTATVLDRIGTTLRAAAVTDEGRELLKSGRLTAELEPPGFDAFAPTRAPSRPRRKPTGGRDELAERRERRAQQQQRRRELQGRARAAERSAREAEREAERVEREAERARQKAERARAEADAAAAALAETD
jgi:hypothetical protein